MIARMAHRVYWQDRTDALIGRRCLLSVRSRRYVHFAVQNNTARCVIFSLKYHHAASLPACSVDSAEVFGTTSASSTALQRLILLKQLIATQQIEVHCHVHVIPSLCRIPSHMNPPLHATVTS